jgi:inorganic pyrophosphatase
VLSDAPSFPGCLVTGKLIGVISAKQTEKGHTIRNDRLLAVPVTPANEALYAHIDDLPVAWLDEIEHFFVSYNAAQGREYTPLGRGGPEEAEKAVAEAEKRYSGRGRQ